MIKYMSERDLVMTLIPKTVHRLAKQYAATCECTMPVAIARLVGVEGGSKGDKPAEPAQTVRQHQRQLQRGWRANNRALLDKANRVQGAK